MNDRDKVDELIQILQECARFRIRPDIHEIEGVLVIEFNRKRFDFPFEFDTLNQVWFLEG